MIRALKKWSPKKIFIVHGDDAVMPIFKKKIQDELGINSEILSLGSKIEFE